MYNCNFFFVSLILVLQSMLKYNIYIVWVGGWCSIYANSKNIWSHTFSVVPPETWAFWFFRFYFRFLKHTCLSENKMWNMAICCHSWPVCHTSRITCHKLLYADDLKLFTNVINVINVYVLWKKALSWFK